MKIAITADVHLTSLDKNPERYHALENILDQLVDIGINTLIIAGDLFDQTCNNPGEFEELVKNSKYGQCTFYIIPGNHDPVLAHGAFAYKNIKYITKPQLLEIPQSNPFLLIPYQPNISMGEALVSAGFSFIPDEWILIAHGQWQNSTKLLNNYEQGVYMPLTSRDLHLYKPRKVFLGHIHACMDTPVVHYPGSPCGLNPTETGIRSFLIYDSKIGRVERKQVETDVIYLQDWITIFPQADERSYLKEVVSQKIANWHLDDSQKKRAKARLIIRGYSTNRDSILQGITELMSDLEIPLLEPPDLRNVNLANDVLRADIALEVQKRLLNLGLAQNEDEPTNDDYVLSALNQIYGG